MAHMSDGMLTLRCACGWEAHGTEAELIVAATEHGRRVHNMTATREDVLAMIVRPDDAAAHHARLDRPDGDVA
jgi:predicted small metal-binding protein